MRVQITAIGGFRCAPEGHTVVTYPIGTILEGAGAEMALAASAGVKVGPPASAKVVSPPEIKTAKPRRRRTAKNRSDN